MKMEDLRPGNKVVFVWKRKKHTTRICTGVIKRITQTIRNNPYIIIESEGRLYGVYPQRIKSITKIEKDKKEQKDAIKGTKRSN